MKVLLILSLFMAKFSFAMTAAEIMKEVDKNMVSNNWKADTTMRVYVGEVMREMKSTLYINGKTSDAFIEYTYPPRDAGTKMLKLKDQMWIYNPRQDRQIKISGHMLRQSIMGSDLSYEDALEMDSITTKYTATIVGEEKMEGEDCYVLDLVAKEGFELAYYKRKIWVSKKHFISMRQDMYSKSGQMMKYTISKDIKKFGNRNFPTYTLYKDNFKEGKGTEQLIDNIEFDVNLPADKFTRASLK